MFRMLGLLHTGKPTSIHGDEPHTVDRSRPVRLAQSGWLIVYGGVGAFVLLFLWFVIARPVQVLPRIRPVPPFVLQDQHEQWVDVETLRGQLLLISFTYTRCGSDCDTTRNQMLALRDELRAANRFGSEISFLTISFDPTHDTPAVLRHYGDQLGAKAPAWHLLTGSPNDLKGVIGGGFGVYYKERAAADEGAPFVFDRRVVLVDAQGLIRAEYDGEQFQPARVLRDIGLIQKEAASSGPMRQVYEASHLFLCYPR